MTERINITVPGDLLAVIDAEAAREHLTRSGFLRAAARERLARTDPAGAWPPPREMVLAILRAFFAARDDVVAAYLFGSTAVDQAGRESDIDVAVLFGEGSDPDDRFGSQLDLAGRMGALFGADRVDVLVLDDAPLHLAAAVIEEGVVVAGEHSARRTRFEGTVREGSVEHARELEGRWRAFSERIARGGDTG